MFIAGSDGVSVRIERGEGAVHIHVALDGGGASESGAPLVTIEEGAALAGVTRRTVRRWIQSGEIQGVELVGEKTVNGRPVRRVLRQQVLEIAQTDQEGEDGN